MSAAQAARWDRLAATLAHYGVPATVTVRNYRAGRGTGTSRHIEFRHGTDVIHVHDQYSRGDAWTGYIVYREDAEGIARDERGRLTSRAAVASAVLAALGR